MAFELITSRLSDIQKELKDENLDGWLLYDFRARNTVSGKLTGLGNLTRRYFVYVPATGEPHAVTHKIEAGPWAEWKLPRIEYSAWRELDTSLRKVLGTAKRIAMEISPNDAVPAMDLVPAGVLEMIRGFGPQVVSSGDLVSRFYSAWTAEDLAAHRRASTILMQAAHAAFQRLANEFSGGNTVREGDVHAWIMADLAARGASAGADCHIAGGANAADPHYNPSGMGAEFKRDEVVLIDLWSKESDDSVYADQTWMGYLGSSVPDRVAKMFEIVCGGRDAAVQFLKDGHAAGRRIMGGEVDDVTRNYITERGYGDAFIHRTGHSIDQAIHGMGPNIDNLETNETRILIPGVGFSIEPGIYLRGDVGMRSEINVFMGQDGPEVTTPSMQHSMLALLP
jgi:Xaa-Pro aminopeptidase